MRACFLIMAQNDPQNILPNKSNVKIVTIFLTKLYLSDGISHSFIITFNRLKLGTPNKIFQNFWSQQFKQAGPICSLWEKVYTNNMCFTLPFKIEWTHFVFISPWLISLAIEDMFAMLWNAITYCKTILKKTYLVTFLDVIFLNFSVMSNKITDPCGKVCPISSGGDFPSPRLLNFTERLLGVFFNLARVKNIFLLSL